MSKRYSNSSTGRFENENRSGRISYLLNERTPFEVMEAFRSIKAALSVSVPQKSGVGTVIMTTSALPNDGKTTVSVNLALMFALSDMKVVIVDADIRKGRVAKFFKQKREPGLSNYLAGQVSLQNMLHRSKENENLFYITCGTNSPRPYELLESNEMKELVSQLREQFDYVIIDTPPVLLVADALALTSLTDGTVLVCRHMESNLNDIERAVKQLNFAKANILGAIVNNYKGMANKKYGYRSYNSYIYSYAYGKRQRDDLTNSSKKATERVARLSVEKMKENAEERKENED